MRRLTILGSGTAVPWRNRAAPGYAVEYGGEDGRIRAILLDAGAGSIHRMASCGIPIERLSHVVLSHLHPDHTGDIVPLLFAFKNPRFEDHPLPVLVGPPGFKRWLAKLSSVYGRWIDHGSRLTVHEFDRPMEEGQPGALYKLGPLEVSPFAVRHTEHSVALRFESRGRCVFTYSGDTDFCPGIIEAARNASVLLIECAYPEGRKVEGHLTPSEVGRIAAAAGAGSVVLTHLYPECAEEDLLTPLKRYFAGPVTIAEDGMLIDLDGCCGPGRAIA